MSRNAFVPMSWITSDLNGEALRTLILLSTYADNKTGECWPTNAVIAKTLGKTRRAVQLSLNDLRTAGMISIVDGQGKSRRIKIESKDWFDRPAKTRRNHEENLHGSTMKKTFMVDKCNHEENLHTNHEENLHGGGEENLHGPNKNSPIELTHELSSGSERLTEESKPTTLAADCALALADLAQPKFDLAPDLKRSVEQLNLHAWIQMLATHGMDPKDWRIRATIEQLHGKGKMASPFGLARKIFNDLPETEPPKTNGHVNGHGKYRQNEPTHVPNLMPKRVKSRNENILTGYWNRLAELPIPGVELKVWADRMHSTPTDLEPAAFEAAMERILTEATETVK